VSADVAAATVPGRLSGVALDHARAMIAAALETLDRLGDQGWSTVAGDAPGGARARSAVRDVVTERTESFDPFGATLGTVP
jgi:hypothetical protein